MMQSFFKCKSIWSPMTCFIRNKAFDVSLSYYLKDVLSAKCSVLQNGVRVVTQEKEMPFTCLGIYIDAGSRYESQKQNGLAHFFQHIAFKGTKLKSKVALEDQMMCNGALFKCFTEREMIGYYVQCFTPCVAMYLNLLIECLFQNLMDCQEIELQKRVVYEEMLADEHNYQPMLNDYLHSAAFQGTSLGQSVVGPSCNLYNYTNETLQSYVCRMFTPQRVVVAVIGGIKHEHILSLVNGCLADLDSCETPTEYIYRYTGSEVRYRDDSVPKANIAIAFEGPSISNTDSIALEIASSYLGGWDRKQGGSEHNTNNLARAAYKENLCDAYQSFNISYSDVSLWGIQFLSKSVTIEDMLYNICDQFMYLCNVVTEAEVDRAKNELKAKILAKAAITANACHELGRYTLYANEVPSIYNRMAAIDEISAENLKSICYKYIYDKCPAVAAVGPTEGLPDYTRIRAGFYWLRI